MKMLRKTIKAIVVIVLLKVVTLILDRLSPDSIMFHRQFLFSLQILVVVWLLVSLLLFIFKAGKSWVARFLPVLIVMAVLGVDILFSFWIENPSGIPGFLRKEFKDYYAAFERNVIEYEPCSVFDSTYSFKIIPGLAFNYGNIEYRNNYVVNSESLRDDEGALMGPQVICVGNAYTIGVGADQDKTFPSLLEKDINQLVLNTGNTSYGTYREMKRIAESDTSYLKYIVVQYSKYDVYENAAYIDGRPPFKVTSDSLYKKARTEYRWKREYFPGKYAMTISYNWAKKMVNKLRQKRHFLSADPVVSADYFLKVLDRFKPAPHVKIIVTEVNDFRDLNSGFLPAVDSLLKKPEFSSLRNMVQTTSVADVLDRGDYYIIDANLRSSGHQKIARRIADIILKDSAQ
ncbi:MAG: hypothetical protein JNK79_20200 [Chitinophagaceae bacterium]|nr:hypothetical protein [Chitinophagaceae bacterium]